MTEASRPVETSISTLRTGPRVFQLSTKTLARGEHVLSIVTTNKAARGPAAARGVTLPLGIARSFALAILDYCDREMDEVAAVVAVKPLKAANK